jgi:hypothetical protein
MAWEWLSAVYLIGAGLVFGSYWFAWRRIGISVRVAILWPVIVLALLLLAIVSLLGNLRERVN